MKGIKILFTKKETHALVRQNITLLDLEILFRENKTKALRSFPFSFVWAQEVILICH